MTKLAGKLAVFYTVLFCGVIGLIELIALAAYWITFRESFSYRDLQASRLALLWRAQEGAVAGSQFAVWVLHPYYGFVTNPDIDRPPVNKFGFLGYEDEIQSANPNNIVIAVIGGSVAAQLASTEYAVDVLESERKKIASFQSKKLTILNLGNGAYKQPQGLIAVNDILSRGGHIDVVIALDGFNEIALPEGSGNVRDGIPPSYPPLWRQLTETKWSHEQMKALAKFSLASDFRAWLAAIFAKPILRHLVTANLIWRSADVQLAEVATTYRKLADVEPRRDPVSTLSNDRRTFLGPVTEYANRRDLYIDIARHWGRSSVLLHNMMAAQGGRYFHFLQPNQYVMGSKPMGERERKTAINPPNPYRTAVEIGYPYLQAMGESLRGAGVWFEDLTPVFADVNRELYVDSCCHVNKEGNAILAKAIATVLATRMANPVSSGNQPLAIDQVNFGSSLFSAHELRRFASNSPDYNDGSRDLIERAKKAVDPRIQPADWYGTGVGTYAAQGNTVLVQGNQRVYKIVECPVTGCDIVFSLQIHQANEAFMGLYFSNDRGKPISGFQQPVSDSKGENRIEMAAPDSTRKVRAVVFSTETGTVKFSDAILEIRNKVDRGH